MEIITFIAGAALATGITYGMKKRNNQTSQITQVTQKEHSQKAIAIKIPGGVGLNPYTQAERIEQELIQAIIPHYFDAVKERILRKNLLSEKEYDVYFLELKRYFVLTTMMKSVPMYNEKVDIIWHEMLMFTKSYDAFCAQFMGNKIHHEPNLNPTPNKEEKGLFDFVYTYFFKPYGGTDVVYPELQKQQLSKNFLITLDTESTDVIIRNYFAPTGDAQYQALRAMIATIKQDLAKAKKQTKRPSYLPANNHRAKTDDTYYNPTEFLMYQLVWHSLVDFPEEKTVATSTSNYGSGSYSGSSGSSRSSSHEDTSSSSSSSSSSNCSSSSCSSSSCSSSSCGSSCSS